MDEEATKQEIFKLAVAWTQKYIKRFPCNECNTSLSSYDMYAPNKLPPLEAAILVSSFGQYENAIEKSKIDQNVFIGIKLQLANFLESGDEIPYSYKQWLISLLRDELKEPLKKRGRESRREDVCLLIYDVIQKLNKRDLITYKNHATSIRRHRDKDYYSAADVVAKAMQLEGRQPNSYEAVVKYYKDGEKIMAEIALEHADL